MNVIMKIRICFVLLLVASGFMGCTSESKLDDPSVVPEWKAQQQKEMENLGWHQSGDFLGQFNVSYFDGDVEVGKGWMDTNGWLYFVNIPGGYIMKKMMPSGKDYIFDETHGWSSELFGYIPIGSSDSNPPFRLRRYDLEGVRSLILGSHQDVDVFFSAVYDESDIAYNPSTDIWAGSIKIKGVKILSLEGKELDRIDFPFSYAINFQSSGRKL